MSSSEKQDHWNKVHARRSTEEVSWFQAFPTLSLRWIEGAGTDLHEPIIDVGGGDSRLAECLLDKGFFHISVLDISEEGMRKAQERMGEAKAKKVEWIVSDIMEFDPNPIYEVWHDRALFHFLTDEEDQQAYARIAAQGVQHAGNLMVGSFSVNGPEKCSGLPVQRHSEESLEKIFQKDFDLLGSDTDQHITPGGKEQEFIFTRFRRK